MAHGMPYHQMRFIFGGDWCRYSVMVNWFARFLFHKVYHSLCGRSLEYWATIYNINELREKFNYVCFDDNGTSIEGLEDVSLDSFRIYGFIDCMMNIYCRPGGGPVNADGGRREDEDEIQRAFYTSYGHQLGAKS